MKKVVLVTGGSSGIGKSIGEYLQAKGYIVYGTSRNPQSVQGSKIPLISLDVQNRHSMQQAVQNIIEKEGKIDVLINNAGVGITGPLEETPISEIERNFQTNVFGPLELIQLILPYMREKKSGMIINITSIAAYMGLPYRGAYSSSKSAFETVSESLSMEVAPFGIKVCTVAPGDFATDIASRRYHAPFNEKSPYAQIYKNQLNTMNSHVQKGENPIKMARAIAEIIEKKQPKLHYKVGSFLQVFSIFLKRILPDRVYENMLKKHYDIK